MHRGRRSNGFSASARLTVGEIMTLRPARSLRAMLDEANAEIRAISGEEAIAVSAREDHLLVDLRDIRELAQDGRIQGAFHCPRGMLEFWIDSDSPYHKLEFDGQGMTYVLFCAGGLRSALATKTAQDMGLNPVMHIAGGFGAWVKAGGPVSRER